MKKNFFILLIVFSVTERVFAYNEDSLSVVQIEKTTILSSLDFSKKSLDWEPFNIVFRPLANYVHSSGYPYGFNLYGLRLGFSKDEIMYYESNGVYKVPTWSLHSMQMRGTNFLGPVGFSAGLDIGLNFAKRYVVDENDESNFFSKTKTYFSIAPLVGINIWYFNAFVGYEFLPAFDELNGFIFGGGVSIPIEL